MNSWTSGVSHGSTWADELKCLRFKVRESERWEEKKSCLELYFESFLSKKPKKTTHCWKWKGTRCSISPSLWHQKESRALIHRKFLECVQRGTCWWEWGAFLFQQHYANLFFFLQQITAPENKKPVSEVHTCAYACFCVSVCVSCKCERVQIISACMSPFTAICGYRPNMILYDSPWSLYWFYSPPGNYKVCHFLYFEAWIPAYAERILYYNLKAL